MAGIELKNIVKEYADGFLAVDDVSLSIADGEFMILVGPSGCGKSTLLRMIVGLEDITSGDMVIDDERVNDKAPRDRNLAMVFQNYALYPHLTVYENIAFPLRLAKMSDSEVRQKVEVAADTLELKEHLQRKPANLSGGQRQRVAMGRAIVRDAKAFLFDEPLSNLDAKLRGQMRTEISRLQKRMGTTTVYVTHDQTEAMTLGDRVAVLRKGVLQQCDTPRELYENPVNLFVAGFIGAPPMNFLPASIKDGKVELPFCTVPLPDDINAEEVEGKLLVAGVRPEFFNDVSFVDEAKRGHGQTFHETVDVTEWLGNEQYAYVPYDSPAEIRAELDALAADLDMEAMRPQLIISLDPASRVEEGTPTEFWIDVKRMHLFDPSSGKNLALADLDLTPDDAADDGSGADSGGVDEPAADGDTAAAVVAADSSEIPADTHEPESDGSSADGPPPGQEDEPVDTSTDADGDADTAEPSAPTVEEAGGPLDPEEAAAEGSGASVDDEEESGAQEDDRPNADDAEKRSGG